MRKNPNEWKKIAVDHTDLTHRDRAVLRAVAEGRCAYTAGTLFVDGVRCCDQFVGPRLARAGLIADRAGTAGLTADGRALLDAA
ncbi:hypothetical protein [Saccharothrix sp. Mg75]|uniref:hypothetical protein n=1 Tax=Saccharothrix sp. Mg75 TaxID=3445357 RepID=UPI003EECB076